MLEAVLFAAGEAVHIKSLAEAIGVSINDTTGLLEQMQKEYTTEERGLRLIHFNQQWQLSTKPEYAAAVLSVFKFSQPNGLSRAALETLSVIAYKQPVTRLIIEQIRGVSSSSSIQVLLDKELIAEAGRLDAPGRPILYKTTDLFLKSVNLSSLKDLPDYAQFESMVIETGEGK